MQIITSPIIRSLGITPQQCIDWIHDSFAMKGDAQLPAKISVHPASFDFFTSMPCLLPSPKETGKRRYFGIKEVHRVEGAVPSLGSDMMLYDAGTGELLALIDCDWITTMRTGAVAAVASRTLRRSDASMYGFVGLGNTARATMMCILEQEPSRHFTVQLLKYKNQAELFADRFRNYENVDFEIVDDINAMAGNVDVFISCITSADGLLVEDVNSFKAGITVLPVHMRGLQNCDPVFDRVFGDDTAHICGFKYFKQYHDYNELGEVLAGRDPGRRNDQQRIIDYNYGLGLHDVVFASRIYEMLEGKDEIILPRETDKFWI